MKITKATLKILRPMIFSLFGFCMAQSQTIFLCLWCYTFLTSWLLTEVSAVQWTVSVEKSRFGWTTNFCLQPFWLQFFFALNNTNLSFIGVVTVPEHRDLLNKIDAGNEIQATQRFLLSLHSKGFNDFYWFCDALITHQQAPWLCYGLRK